MIEREREKNQTNHHMKKTKLIICAVLAACFGAPPGFRTANAGGEKPSPDVKEQLASQAEEIEKLKEKIYCLENDTIMLNMEQRLIDISLVLDGKLTSKDTK